MVASDLYMRRTKIICTVGPATESAENVTLTPNPAAAHACLVLLEEFTAIAAMTKATMELAYKKGIVLPGNKVVIVAGHHTLPWEKPISSALLL